MNYSELHILNGSLGDITFLKREMPTACVPLPLSWQYPGGPQNGPFPKQQPQPQGYGAAGCPQPGMGGYPGPQMRARPQGPGAPGGSYPGGQVPPAQYYQQTQMGPMAPQYDQFMPGSQYPPHGFQVTCPFYVSLWPYPGCGGTLDATFLERVLTQIMF